MSRPLRIEYPGAWYHVMNRGRRGEDIFANPLDQVNFLDLLMESSDMWTVDVCAYCLMTNHYHLLIHTPQGNLSRFMRHVNGVYTQRFNRANGVDGPLFKGRYKAIMVKEGNYLMELVRYIHRNPLKAGLVDDLAAYPHSSHKAYMSQAKKWDWVNKARILSLFSADLALSRKLYKKFVYQEDSEEIAKIFASQRMPAFLGSKKFVAWVKETFGLGKSDPEVPEAAVLRPDADAIIFAICNKCLPLPHTPVI